MSSANKKDVPRDIGENSELTADAKKFDRLFTLYSKIGCGAGENTMSLQGAKLWLEQAKLLDENKGIAETDVEKTFSATDVTGMNKEEFKAWIEDLAKQKDKDPKDLMNKLINSGPPAAGNRSDLISTTRKRIKP
ncbi:hypothetical protein AVEN_63716-1 [Araneus ventricosus]|uniref:TPPP family protein CG4893 n=1 Tax=Araneus ventricosus TaxID=182803 RepID=A0A4Y2L6C7_ARAVE|nr:hypothetical protein AVEN_63716-1 [Araneus ventricosus]